MQPRLPTYEEHIRIKTQSERRTYERNSSRESAPASTPTPASPFDDGLYREVLKTLDEVQRERCVRTVGRAAECYVKLRLVLRRISASLPAGQFVIVVETNGDIVYVSSPTQCQQRVTLSGTSIYDYVHKSWHATVKTMLTTGSHGHQFPTPQTAALAMATTFQGSSESVIVPLRTGLPIKITGKLFPCEHGDGLQLKHVFVGLVEPQLQSGLTTTAMATASGPLDNGFPFPHFSVVAVLDWVATMEMKLLWGDRQTRAYLGYARTELAGVSVFELLHAEDQQICIDALEKMYKRGEHQSPCYRMIIKSGGWAWFVTQASTLQITLQGQPTTVCVGRQFMVTNNMTMATQPSIRTQCHDGGGGGGLAAEFPHLAALLRRSQRVRAAEAGIIKEERAELLDYNDNHIHGNGG